MLPALTWTWWGVPGLLVLLTGVAFAVAALRAGFQRELNRRLAVVLLIEGIHVGCNFGALFFFESEAAVTVIAHVGMVAAAVLPFQYLVFLGSALETPLVRPLKTRLAHLLLQVLSVAAAVAVLAFPASFMTELYSPGWAPWNYRLANLGNALSQLLGITSLFGFVAAVHAYAMAPPGSISRERAFWFVIALGSRDVVQIGLSIFYPILRPIELWGDLLYNPINAGLFLVYMAFLAYGVLRSQMFDIDLRIRIALERGTVGGLLAAIFFLATQALEAVFPVEGFVQGALLALLIAGLLRPAQSLAGRAIGRLMPDVRHEAAYISRRKLEVYRGALEAALEAEGLTPDEVAVIRKLRARLEIADGDAAEIERALGVSVPRSVVREPPGSQYAPEGG